ncbi:hypothetical protein J4E90_009505 [Alternaria incomplexa]|uniref:uncharacterized protein n=1 Tax=Alternaria incomplexa TaxID=1187928 RepID=UPI0022201D64|nr:uncharacterized protein J4E90_009505 [Alternaria incomplexa]KAI4907476.1 hypothetical protein J4E90_009505 [Alternaria incomplexa]
MPSTTLPLLRDLESLNTFTDLSHLLATTKETQKLEMAEPGSRGSDMQIMAVVDEDEKKK